MLEIFQQPDSDLTTTPGSGRASVQLYQCSVVCREDIIRYSVEIHRKIIQMLYSCTSGGCIWWTIPIFRQPPTLRSTRSSWDSNHGPSSKPPCQHNFYSISSALHGPLMDFSAQGFRGVCMILLLEGGRERFNNIHFSIEKLIHQCLIGIIPPSGMMFAAVDRMRKNFWLFPPAR